MIKDRREQNKVILDITKKSDERRKEFYERRKEFYDQMIVFELDRIKINTEIIRLCFEKKVRFDLIEKRLNGGIEGMKRIINLCDKFNKI